MFQPVTGLKSGLFHNFADNRGHSSGCQDLLLPELAVELAGPDELLQVLWLLTIQHVQHNSV